MTVIIQKSNRCKKDVLMNIMTAQKDSRFAVYFVIFGFMLIIATGTDMLFSDNKTIPLWVSLIGLVSILIGFFLRKQATK